ncbi:MAG: sodium:proton antiporter, partial [Gemmatimonadota bacterium]|nr:sodium:proton antiporter [Gemmatimonadota bacterium]
MTAFDVLAVLTTITALLAWINYRFVRLPTTIGLMVISLLFSLGLVAAGNLGLGIRESLQAIMGRVDFDETLLNGMLGAMLFAGALHINLNDLAEERGIVAVLATAGVVISTAVVGGLSWFALHALGQDTSFIYCLVFGALISPTDPIAVGAILRKIGLPKNLLVAISGESLFNDGVGVVVFLVLLEIATGHQAVSGPNVLKLLAVEGLGGMVYGAAVGWVAYRMLKSVDNYQVEILITLALVTGGYALAHRLHVSGPLAMVVAGLMIGNQGRAFAMSEQTRDRLDAFWELVDEFLNALLFVLIGAEVLVLTFSVRALVAGAVAVPIVLAARYISVAIPSILLSPW